MLQVGSESRLLASLFVSVLSTAFFLWGMSLSFWGGAFGFAFSLHGLMLAIHLMGAKEPLVRIEGDGLWLSPRLGGPGLLPWDKVGKVTVLKLHWPAGFSLPWADYLMIRVKDSHRHFRNPAKFLPSLWFGFYLLPARLVAGGTAEAEAFEKRVAEARDVRTMRDSLDPQARTPSVTEIPRVKARVMLNGKPLDL